MGRSVGSDGTLIWVRLAEVGNLGDLVVRDLSTTERDQSTRTRGSTKLIPAASSHAAQRRATSPKGTDSQT